MRIESGGHGFQGGGGHGVVAGGKVNIFAPGIFDTLIKVNVDAQLPVLINPDARVPGGAFPEKFPGAVFGVTVYHDQFPVIEGLRALKRAGHKSFIVSVNMPERGGVWYRVRIGPFNSKREAWTYKRDFEERERLPVFVVKRRKRG